MPQPQPYTFAQSLALRGFDVAEVLVSEATATMDDRDRLEAMVKEAIQHLTHGRPAHALRALEKAEV